MQKLNSAYLPISIFLLAISACSSGPTENTGINQKRSEKDSTYNICFTSMVKKDTVLFNALVYGDSIRGSLGYKLYEKKQQNGSLTGSMREDTLWGTYTFMAADSEFVNEVTYLRRDSLLIEGLGERHFDGKQFVFTDKSKLRYNGIRLIRTDCRQLPGK